MGAVDYGTQTISVDFYNPADSGIINLRHLLVRPLGIYSGGYLTRVSDVSISLSALICEIDDGTYQVKVKTANTVAAVTVAVATPYVVLRWAYTGAVGNYMDVMAVAVGDILTTDLVIGMCNFTGSTLTGFDYTLRATPTVFDLFLKVEPTVAASMRVRIRAGRVNYGSVNYNVVDQLSPVFAAPGANSRIDVLYVDTDGAVKVLTGIAAAVPVAPSYAGKVVLAEITITSATTSLTADEITDVRAFSTGGVVDYVDLTTNQSVAGIKTFGSFMVTPSSAPTTDYQVSNKKYVDDALVYVAANYVKLTTNQIVAGVKTFSSFPVTPSLAPTTDYQVANKKYVDDSVAAAIPTDYVKLTTDQNVAGVKAFSSFPTTPSSAPTTNYQAANKKYVDDSVAAVPSNYVKLTTDQVVAGVKTFSSFPITPSSVPTTNYQVANKKYVDDRYPTGSLTMWAGALASPPTDWLVCDGTAVSRTTYSGLFAVISTTYGAGNGSTTFNLPNFTNRFPYGANEGSAAGNASVGSAGVGSHTVTGNDNNLVQSTGGGALANVGSSEIGTAPNQDVMSPYLAVAFIIKT